MSEKRYIDNPLNPSSKILYLGDLYRKLVCEGIIIHDFKNDPVVVQEIQYTHNELKVIKKEHKNKDYYIIRGRGLYNGYWVKAYRKLNKNEEIIEKNKKSYIIVYNN